MVTFESKPYSKRLLHLISWSHWFTLFNIIAAIALSSFYIFNESKPESLIGVIYLITTWTSHMGFLTFMSLVLILFPITLLIPQTRFIRGTASIIFTIGLFLLILDGFVYSRLGYHLNASSSEQIISLLTTIGENNDNFWLYSAVVGLLILAAELVISNYAWKHLSELQETVFAKFIVIPLVLFFFVSHVIHIWADANLEYDVLQQDTVLPLSYPSTAKALLTKYDLFDREDYIERRNSPLSFRHTIPQYPRLNTQLNQQCPADAKLTQSAYLVLTNEILTDKQIQQFKRHSSDRAIDVKHHTDNALLSDAWFNLFFSLPTIYQEQLIAQNSKPLLFQALEQTNAVKNFTVIGNNEPKPYWFESLFDTRHNLTDISSLIFSDNNSNFTEQLNTAKPGLHVIYFNEPNTHQFELFMDALLLAQSQKETKDIIWVSSIGNSSQATSLTIKPSLLIMPKADTSNQTVKRLSSQMDIQPTLLNNWLNCQLDERYFPNGQNLLKIKSNRLIANTMESGIMVFNKDQSVFIDQNGNFQSYSIQLDAPITVKANFPLMIDAVHSIKQFSQQKQSEQ
ncbi:MAG: membrane-anchored protein YejM (alkaline phosphatase superfamily) [Alteromonadaceae bacterium]|jgi:membrane-anchored protein YejM (alkaline phosphatase superfamily)